MKPYLFTYSLLCPTWHAQGILNETSAIETWVQPFPNAAIVVSNLDARDLAAVLRNRLGETWFLITELHTGSVDGLLPANLWDFVNSAATASLPGLSAYQSPGLASARGGSPHQP